MNKEEAEFIDELVEFYKKEFSPFMSKYHERFEASWEEEREIYKKEKSNLDNEP